MDFKHVTFDEGMVAVAECYAAHQMTKEAAIDWARIGDKLKSLGTTVMSNPYIYGPLVGAGAGGALGALSAQVQPKERRNYFGRGLTGALLGGLAGAAVPSLHTAWNTFTSPSNLDKVQLTDVDKQLTHLNKNPTQSDRLQKNVFGPDANPESAAVELGRQAKDLLFVPRSRPGHTMGPAGHPITSLAVGGTVGATSIARDALAGRVNPASRMGSLVGGNSPKLIDLIKDPKQQQAVRAAHDWMTKGIRHPAAAGLAKPFGLPLPGGMRGNSAMREIASRGTEPALAGHAAWQEAAKAHAGKGGKAEIAKIKARAAAAKRELAGGVVPEAAAWTAGKKAMKAAKAAMEQAKTQFGGIASPEYTAAKQRFEAARLATATAGREAGASRALLQSRHGTKLDMLKREVDAVSSSRRAAAALLNSLKATGKPELRLVGDEAAAAMRGAAKNRGWRSMLGRAASRGTAAGALHMAVSEALRRAHLGEKLLNPAHTLNVEDVRRLAAQRARLSK